MLFSQFVRGFRVIERNIDKMKQIGVLIALSFLLLVHADNVFSQTPADSTIVGRWKQKKIEMIMDNKKEQRREKEIYQFNLDRSFKYISKGKTLTGKWDVVDSTLQLMFSSGRSAQIEIFKLTKTELILYCEDGPAKFYSVFKRQKVKEK